MVLHQTPHKVVLGQIAGHGAPTGATVGGLDQVGRKVAVLVVVESHVGGVGIVEIGDDVVDEGGVGDTGQIAHRDGLPVPTTIGADLDEAVIGTRPEHTLLHRRLGQRGDGVVGGHGLEVPRRGGAPLTAHERHQHPVLVLRQIRAHRSPAVAAVFGPPHPL